MTVARPEQEDAPCPAEGCCGSGACESCECCSGGFHLDGSDGPPGEQYWRWWLHLHDEQIAAGKLAVTPDPLDEP